MKMNIADNVKAELEAAIRKAIEDWKRDTNEETIHFAKNSKLDRVTMIKMLCLMGGNSLRKELHDYPEVNVTASSFSERRAAINSELRWREEIFFRHIKYDCGASRMKCKKEEYSRQELYGHFIASAAVWKIINGIVLEQNPNNTYEYKINIKMATYLVKKFLATPDASGEQLIADISRYLVQVKPDRANVRNLRPTSFVPFNYRVA